MDHEILLYIHICVNHLLYVLDFPPSNRFLSRGMRLIIVVCARFGHLVADSCTEGAPLIVVFVPHLAA